MRRPIASGFTLTELLVALAVLGILLGVAVPSYQEFVFRGRRAEGRVALLELMQAQEHYAYHTQCYLGFSNTPTDEPVLGPSCAGSAAVAVPFKNYSGDSLAQSHYRLSAAACPGASIRDCVEVMATPVKPDPAVGTLSLTSLGDKSCSGTERSKCWR
ncbi:type IV pilin protein [Rhodoferax sp.]|jgi:type IV pilus assembly protein PilE|uniref:type IV pilin protein n=1 Tax=Rhodoferax sp. TaxID=50421 RepID=UPI0037834714